MSFGRTNSRRPVEKEGGGSVGSRAKTVSPQARIAVLWLQMSPEARKLAQRSLKTQVMAAWDGVGRG
ncbi:hypothetical protein KUCAC02_013228 [Chaenocephalus aceratus]|uniref:Uncharacterized protein n=1 Tax=Chaenocephalus aceratus TaxID=36190 RepID=A0ACB9XCZ7_CHAAC|nr:hypothetical protein KUCAC02_013228 [Chaenocephalus aceratus]